MNILDKYYRVHCQINLDNIYDNITNLKNNINDKTGMVAVIKTDGYGHGAVPIAKKIYDIVDAYAVATVDEGVNLRKHGIDKPVYMLGFIYKKRIIEAVSNDIRIAVFDYDTALCADEVAKGLGVTAKIHIKVDTGMSRIGFKDNDESVNIISDINKLKNVEIEGIFTHFSRADERDKTNTFGQIERFESFIKKLEENNVNIPVKHCSNSAGIIDIKEANFNEVRVGIALYGLYPSEEVSKSNVLLKPALEMKSHIIFVKDIEAGTPVSYGGTYVAENNMRIATVPVGYGDGYPRSLSNKGYVLINGKRANILGRVCMDQMMVDITDLDAKEGDVVTLVGRDGDAFLSVEEVADMAGTFNYEFVCDIGKRVPRVYISDNKIIGGKDYFYDNYELTTL